MVVNDCVVQNDIVVKQFGLQAYQPIWQAMQQHVDARTSEQPDELWFLQHSPVYTQGRRTQAHDLIDTGTIPVVAIDRGGLATYHGPGQLVVYCLIDLKRRGLGVRALVCCLERAVIALLAEHGIHAKGCDKARGVYVAGAKIASLGLRIRRGISYHGLALNVDMDLSPFAGIVPCGLQGVRMTQCRNIGIKADLDSLAQQLQVQLVRHLGYQKVLG